MTVSKRKPRPSGREDVNDGDASPLATYQATFGSSASSDEVDAYEEQFGETHPVFRVPHRPERHTLGGTQ